MESKRDEGSALSILPISCTKRLEEEQSSLLHLALSDKGEATPMKEALRPNYYTHSRQYNNDTCTTHIL